MMKQDPLYLEKGIGGSNSDQNVSKCVSPQDDEEMEKAIVKKLDYIFVMPWVCALSMIQFFDKSALNYSSMLGIKEDNLLNDTQFGWVGSIFFIGYLCFQIPTVYLIQKIPLGRFLGVLMVCWGTTLGLTAISKNFTHLMIFRFLLGIFEAAVFPSVSILISRLYRRDEQFTRIAIFYIVSGLAMSTGGILSYGIGHMSGIYNLNAWQWIMIILGGITVIVGVLCFFILKDDARSIVKSPSELVIIDLRIKDNSVVVTREFKMSQITEALTESRYYCFMGFTFLVSLQNGAFLVFSSIITKGFGFSNLNSILLGIPSGITDIGFIVIALVWQYRLVKSAYHYLACLFLLCSSIGHLLLITIPLSQAKLVGLYFCFAYVASVVLIATSISNNISGYTKKIFYNSSIIVFLTLGSFAGPQMMLESQKPTYIGGLVGYIVANLVSVCLILIARHNMAQRNNKRLPQQQDDHFSGRQADITDTEDPHFIYKL